MASQLFLPVHPHKHAAELSPQTSESTSILRTYPSHKRCPGTKPEDIRVETPESFYALVDFRTSKALWRTCQTPLIWRRVDRQRRKANAPPRDENR
jgi:hypothetical protein